MFIRWTPGLAKLSHLGEGNLSNERDEGKQLAVKIFCLFRKVVCGQRPSVPQFYISFLLN